MSLDLNSPFWCAGTGKCEHGAVPGLPRVGPASRAAQESQVRYFQKVGCIRSHTFSLTHSLSHILSLTHSSLFLFHTLTQPYHRERLRGRCLSTATPVPHGGARPVRQKSTYLTRLTLGPYVVQSPPAGANRLGGVGGISQGLCAFGPQICSDEQEAWNLCEGLQPHPGAGSSWPSWPKVSHSSGGAVVAPKQTNSREVLFYRGRCSAPRLAVMVKKQ